MNDYTVKNGIIYSENGLPWMPRLFCDDRLMFEIDDNAVTEVRYFSPDSFGSSIILKKNFVSSINFYLETPDTNHGLLPKKTQLLPCGFDAEWKVRNIITEFSVYALKNSIVITLKTPENIPEGYNFKCEFSEKGFFMPLSSVPSEFCNPQLGGPERKWGKFRFEDNNFFNSFIEKEGDKECSIGFNVGFDFGMSFRETANNKKFAMKSEDLLPSRNYHMVISFDESNEAARNKCDFIIQNAQKLIDEQKARYKKVAEAAPVLYSSNKELCDFMALAPMYHESLKILDHHGAIRANTKHYMAWGSDSLFRGYSLGFWGDNEYNAAILDIAQKNGFPLICAYGNDCETNLHYTGKFDNNDAVYIVHLYEYIVCGGKLTKERYDFAKSIFSEIQKLERNNEGLFCTGTILHFDYSYNHDSMKATDEMYGVKENGLMYQAAKAMQALSSIMKDYEITKQANELAHRFESNFIKVCFNEDTGYFPIATNRTNGEHLESYCSYLMLFENDFLTDAMEESFKPAVDYFCKNYVSANGIRPLSKNDSGYDADANQMHGWWPAYNAEYYARMITMTDRPELVKQFISWITYWSNRLTMPEGYDCYDDNPNPDFDLWNQCCGAWAMNNDRAFYQTVIRSVLGIDFDHNGITAYPYTGEEMSVENLKALGKNFNIAVKGSGKHIAEIIVNGKSIKGTNRIPFDMLGEYNEITVIRCKEAIVPCAIRCLNGVEMSNYLFTDGKLSVDITLYGHSVLKIVGNARITLNGIEIKPEKDYPSRYILEGMGKYNLVIEAI